MRRAAVTRRARMARRTMPDIFRILFRNGLFDG
jgi:hypothetical protein